MQRNDIRIEYLRFVENHQGMLTVAANIAFLYVITVEPCIERKIEDKQLAIIWAICLLIKSMICHSAKICRNKLQTQTDQDTGIGIKIQNLIILENNLDLVGLIWFISGHLALTQFFSTKGPNMFMTLMRLEYCLWYYLSWFTIILFQMSLCIFPPISEHDQDYWIRSRFYYSLDSGGIIDSSIYGPNNNDIWELWLRSYDCYDVSPQDINRIPTSTTIDNDDMIVCCICLDNLCSSSASSTIDSSSSCSCNSASGNHNNSTTTATTTNIYYNTTQLATEISHNTNTNIIVRYPCKGHHYYHAHCLYSWLKTASTKKLDITTNKITIHYAPCPCCRQIPTTNSNNNNLIKPISNIQFSELNPNNNEDNTIFSHFVL